MTIPADPAPPGLASGDPVQVRRKLVGSLYVEAMVLADEARAYFDTGGREERAMLDPLDRVGFSCESLKVTTRLMHVIAWLLTQRALDAGELAPRDALDPSRRLGSAPAVDEPLVRALPPRAAALIVASADLHRRVALLDAAQDEVPAGSPARALHARLAMAF